MLFGRQKRGGLPPHVQADVRAGAADHPEFYRIDFDMMLKGGVVNRRKGPVRQVGVTVDGSTRLVTSGDTVDRATYEALIKAGVIRPIPSDTRPEASKEP